jgi:hypothetical protein
MEPLNAAEIEEVRAHNYLRAIKLYRDRTGVGIVNGKRVVEAYGDANGLRSRGPCPHCSGTGQMMIWRVR